MSKFSGKLVAGLWLVVGCFAMPGLVHAQTIPFVVFGSGAVEDLPLSVGPTAEHATTGWATKVGAHAADGAFRLVSPPDLDTLVAEFESARPNRFVSVANPNDVLACNYGVTNAPLPAAEPGRAQFITIDEGEIPDDANDPTTRLDNTFIIQFLAEFRPALDECSGRFAPSRLKKGSFIMLAYSEPVKIDPVNGLVVGATPDGFVDFSWIGVGTMTFKWPFAFF